MLLTAPIEELLLDFSNNCGEFRCKTVMYEGKKRTVQFAIPHVRYLDLSFPAYYEIDTLLEGLHFPALERLSLSVCDPVDEDFDVRRGREKHMYDYDYDYDEYGGFDDDVEYFNVNPANEAADAALDLSKLFFKDKQFPKLTSLSVKLDLNAARLLDKELSEKYFVDIFESCPNVQDLELRCTYPTKSLLLPPLRSLTLNRVVVDYNCTWIENYGKLLSKYEKMDSFERLTLNHCVMGHKEYAMSEEEWIAKLSPFSGKVIIIL